MDIAIRGRAGGYPEMIENFRKKGINTFGIKGSLEEKYYYIGKEGNLVVSYKPKGYVLYNSIEDIIEKPKIYELW